MEKPKWPKLSKEALQSICPLKAGKPDLYNHLPTRMIPREESQARGWTHFYIGDVCRYGHKAPRWVSNPDYCVDCHRTREGRLTIGGKGEAEYSIRARSYPKNVTRGGGPSTAVATVPRDPEPDALEKRFLTKYAELRDFQAAATDVGRTDAEFRARLSYSKVFQAAVAKLEADLGLIHTTSLTEDYDWTDDKRIVLIRTFVNTGDLNAAITAVGCSNWHYERELQDNPDFAEAMAQADKIANKILDRVAVSKAIQGDSRLLQRVLAAKLPEYSERMRLDVNLTEKLSDDQLNERLLQALSELRVPIVNRACVDAEFTDVEQIGEIEDSADGGEGNSPPPSESNLDLL
jgi:hypothetical protein